MEKRLKVAIGQMEVIPARPDLNFKKAKSLVSDAKNQGADLLILPELCISGYLIGDLWEEQSFIEDCIHYGEEIRKLADGIAIAFGNVCWGGGYHHDGRPRKVNALFVAQNRRWTNMCEHLTLPYQPKTLLPNYREFEESRHFTSLVAFGHVFGRKVEELLQPVDPFPIQPTG